MGVEIEGDDNVVGAVASGEGASATQGGTINVGAPPAGRSRGAAPSAADDPPAESELPPYRAVLVVDTEGSTRLTSRQMADLPGDIVSVLERAFDRAGLAEAWRDRRFRMQGHRGDDYVVGLPPATLPRLLHPFLRELQETLRERDRNRLHRDPSLRLRASIHVGPLPDAGGWTDGVGKPMADTHRLLDSDQVRRLLRETHREVTFLAVIVSRRVFEDVVEAGYTDLHPEQFVPVVAAVESKGFAERAYLYLPQHSVQQSG